MLRILKAAFIIQQSETPGFHAWNLKTREEPSESLPVVSRRIVRAPGGSRTLKSPPPERAKTAEARHPCSPIHRKQPASREARK